MLDPISTEVLVQDRSTMFHTPAYGTLRRSVARLREHLILARDADVRLALVVLAGRPDAGAPAWAWLAPGLLHDLLGAAGVSPAEFMERVDVPAASKKGFSLTLPLTSAACVGLPPVEAFIRAKSDRLMVKARLHQRLYVTTGRVSTCVVEKWTNHTLAGALPNRPATTIMLHPLLQSGGYRVVSAPIVKGKLRARIPMKWSPLEPLPKNLAAAFPHNPGTDRSAIGWG